MNTKIIGNDGENKAGKYLENKGYSIVCKNWRTKSGEIDIIVEQVDFLIFVEVKSLPNGTKDMLERELNRRKQERIIKTSKCFLKNHRQYSNKYIRYDVIVMDMPGFPVVYHIENAFSE